MRASWGVALLITAPLCCSIRIRDVTADDGLPDWAKAPIVWVHTPKTGTSFLNTLLHHKGLCPAMPEDAWFMRPAWTSDHKFLTTYKMHELCPGQFNVNYPCPPGSMGVADIWEKNHDHVISFFRQPEARLESGFYSGWHDWPHTIAKQTSGGKNIRTYAKIMQGCQVRMLVSGSQDYKGKACGGNGTLPTDDDVKLAISRMNQMKFVGITEEFDLSLCLFHKMYGGKCHDNEFQNIRPGRGDAKKAVYTYHGRPFTADELDLKGFKDPYDGPLYDAAKDRFFKMLKEHGVDRASCEQSCGSQLKTNPFSVLQEGLEESSFLEGGDGFKYDWPGRPKYIVDEDYETKDSESDL